MGAPLVAAAGAAGKAILRKVGGKIIKHAFKKGVKKIASVFLRRKANDKAKAIGGEKRKRSALGKIGHVIRKEGEKEVMKGVKKVTADKIDKYLGEGTGHEVLRVANKGIDSAKRDMQTAESAPNFHMRAARRPKILPRRPDSFSAPIRYQ
jgi:hypothetical protein